MSEVQTLSPLYAAIRGAVAANEARLQAQSPESKNAGADCAAMLAESGAFALSQNIADYWERNGIKALSVFRGDCNPKSQKRFVQMSAAIVEGNYRKIDKTSCLMVWGLHLSGAKGLTRDALAYLSTGFVKEGGMSPETRGVSRQRLSRLIGQVKQSTFQTQFSRSTGTNGFMHLTGATKGEPGKSNMGVTLNADHPLVRDFLNMMQRATDGQFEQVLSGGKGD